LDSYASKARQHRLCFVADFHREGYSKLEITLALMREKENGTTVEELCHICGRSITWVYQHLTLSDLVPELKKLLDPSLPKSERLSFSIGCRIARAPQERQMEIYRQVVQVTGSRLRLIKVNQLLAEIIPDRNTGRPRKPADYVHNLGLIIPRAAADALTADGFPEKAFTSLVDNKGPQVVVTMLENISTAIQGLKSLKEKIQAAQKRQQKQ